MKILAAILAGSFFLLTYTLVAQEKATAKKLSQPGELGSIRWNRDWESAIALSKKTGRPLFVQFQEVPG